MKERWRQILQETDREYHEANGLPEPGRIFEDPDGRFLDAHAFLRQRRARSRATPQDITAASEALIHGARAMNGDPLAWSFVLAVFEDFVSAGEPPPMPILVGLSEIFGRIRTGMDWADAVRGHKTGKGRPPKSANLLQRCWSRTNAGIVKDLMGRGFSYTEATEKASRMRGFPRKRGQISSASPSSMRADYDSWIARRRKRKD